MQPRNHGGRNPHLAESYPFLFDLKEKNTVSLKFVGVDQHMDRIPAISWSVISSSTASLTRRFPVLEKKSEYLLVLSFFSGAFLSTREWTSSTKEQTVAKQCKNLSVILSVQVKCERK